MIGQRIPHTSKLRKFDKDLKYTQTTSGRFADKRTPHASVTKCREIKNHYLSAFVGHPLKFDICQFSWVIHRFPCNDEPIKKSITNPCC